VLNGLRTKIAFFGTDLEAVANKIQIPSPKFGQKSGSVSF